jgi:hypothetical protein
MFWFMVVTRTRRLSMLISDDEWTLLQKLAELRGVSVSNWVRDIIRRHSADLVGTKVPEVPEGLDEEGELAARIIGGFAVRHGLASGSKFYSPAQWRRRNEEYGTDSKLIVCYDGGDLRSAMSLDVEEHDLVDALRDELEKHGLYSQECTTWYAAVHPIEPEYIKVPNPNAPKRKKNLKRKK